RQVHIREAGDIFRGGMEKRVSVSPNSKQQGHMESRIRLIIELRCAKSRIVHPDAVGCFHLLPAGNIFPEPMRLRSAGQVEIYAWELRHSVFPLRLDLYLCRVFQSAF